MSDKQFTEFNHNQQLFCTCILGLIVDIIIVGVIKAIVRRRRPAVDDNPLSFGPDKYSFPSGHASRSIFLFCFFTALEPVPIIFFPPLFAWTAAICFSRLVLYRHHLLDVFAGMAIGLFNSFLLAILWCDQDTSAWIINWMTDERLSGPEYDV